MSEEQKTELTLKAAVHLMWSGRWVLIATTLCVGVLGSLYVRTLRPVYQADALVQIESKGGKGAGMLGELDQYVDQSSPASVEIELMRSRMVLGAVAKQRGMDVWSQPLGHDLWQKIKGVPRPRMEVGRFEVPEDLVGVTFRIRFGNQGKYELTCESMPGKVQGIVAKALDAKANPFGVGLFITSIKDVPAGTEFLLQNVGTLGGVGRLSGNFGASEKGRGTGLVKLIYKDFSPVTAASILNDIANAYLRQNVERKSAEAQKTLEFLETQLPDLKKQLEESEQKLNDFRIRVGSVDLSAEAQIALNQQVATHQKLLELEQRKKGEQKLFKVDHPNVRIIDSVAGVVQEEAKAQEAVMRTLPLQQQEYLRLSRDVQVNTGLYTGLLNNVQQLKVVKAGEVGNVRIVDVALRTSAPVKPNKKLLMLVSFLAGFALGAAYLVGRRAFKGGVEDPRAIEKALGLMVYASIPHSAAQQKLDRAMRRKEKGMQLLTQASPEDLAVESLKSLRTTLHFSMLDAPNKILLLVGPSPELGKSFVSANFAATLAQTGKKVLLVDADLRRGHLHRYFGVERGLGLSDILAGNASVEQVVQATAIQGLSLMTTGTLPPNPAELLMHENCLWVMERFKDGWDYVVMDTAPILAVTDALILGKMVGTTLMVLKHGRHAMAEIEACQKRLSQSNVPLKGAVFNDVMLENAGNAYGTAAYQYDYVQRDRR